MDFTVDLTQTPPRSPRVRLGGYVILARAIDKCRATLIGKNGGYNFNSPLDQELFRFKGVAAAAFRQAVASGLGDAALVEWLNRHGTPRSAAEIAQWSDQQERASLLDNPQWREFFIAECIRLGLDPERTTRFDRLEADDRDHFTRNVRRRSPDDRD